MQFYYTTLVGTANPKALERLQSYYDFAGYPSTFFGGGYQLVVGAPVDSTTFLYPLIACGERAAPPIGLVAALEYTGFSQYMVTVRASYIAPANQAPFLSKSPEGPWRGLAGQPYQFSITADDYDGDRVCYRWAWGDGDTSTWSGLIAHDSTNAEQHQWTGAGTYELSVQARDLFGAVSNWSPSATIIIARTCCVVRADIDDNATAADIADLVYLVAYMFQSGPPPACPLAADVNGDSVGPDIADLVYLVSFMFQGGAPPVACP